MKEANPADYIPRARSTYDEFRKRHPFRMRWEYFKLTVSEWWCERWSKQLPESDYWERYKELHAGRSILLDAEKALRAARLAPWKNQYSHPQYWWTTCLTLQRRREEIEREIEEVKR